MQIDNCLVILKQTAMAQGGRAASFARKGDETAKRLLHADAEQKRTVDTVRRALKFRKIAFEESSLAKLNAALKRQLAAADLVISIGGDGTLLGASHYVRNGMMLGVNSAPGDSVGHFCVANRRNFVERLDAILNLKWRPVELARLQITLDGKPLPELALNDVLIAHYCPAATTRYLIEIGDHFEEHRSSGVWISTAAGSTAGIGSAGGRRMPLRSRHIQFLVRELYYEPGLEYELTRGLVPPDSGITIASKMPDGRLYIDGARSQYLFPFGARAHFEIAQENLKLFL
ncbi:MAG TPA: NAD(+)/NADH kinase [Blastocatellia bacterium]|nr:NAD(+)/NADH kinase [Blastocatellia bacterium]